MWTPGDEYILPDDKIEFRRPSGTTTRVRQRDRQPASTSHEQPPAEPAPEPDLAASPPQE